MASDDRAALPDDDSQAVDFIVQHLKSEGIFDSLRKACLQDMDHKAAFHTQTHKIEEFVKRYCDKTEWTPTLNKNQHRERLRRTLDESEMMRFGVERLVDDAVTAKESSFYAPIEKTVRDMLGIRDEPEAAHDGHNHVADGSVDMEIEEQEDMDRGEQDMELSDVDDAGAIEPQGIASRIEEFVRSFREVKTEPVSADPPVQPSVASIPVPPMSAPSSSGSPSDLEAPMYSPIRPDDEAFISFKPQDSVPGSSVSTDAAAPPTTAAPVISPPEPVVKIEPETQEPKLPQEVTQVQTDNQPLSQVKQEPKATTDKKSSAVKKQPLKETASSATAVAVMKDLKPQPPARVQRPRRSSDGKDKAEKTRKKSVSSIKLEPIVAPEPEEILSDVSSVHTSDLSDYDDQISLSSEGEDADEKRKISLEEVRRLEDQVKKSSIASNNQPDKQAPQPSASKKKKKGKKAVASAKTTRRERKVNPKYASDEYIVGKKSGSLVGDENIDSDEDFDLQQETPTASTAAAALVKQESTNNSPDDSSSFIDFRPKAGATKVKVEAEAVGEASPAVVPKVAKKKAPRKMSERYDASDLYKPRPAIGSSRRNRSQPGDQ